MSLINHVDQFAEHITRWHTSALLQLQKLIEAPDDVAIEVTDHDTGTTRTLTGVERQACIEGILIAREIVKELPFTITKLDVVPDEPVTEETVQ